LAAELGPLHRQASELNLGVLVEQRIERGARRLGAVEDGWATVDGRRGELPQRAQRRLLAAPLTHHDEPGLAGARGQPERLEARHRLQRVEVPEGGLREGELVEPEGHHSVAK